MFSLVHKKTTSNNHSLQAKKPSMIFEFKNLVPQRMPLPTPPQPEKPMKTDLNVPKMKWGKPIWTFFHVSAEKIKPEYFSLIIKEYLQNIVLICNILPCPICSKHASEYLRSINLNNIRTKDDLVNFFFTFHNVVNIRKGFPVLAKSNIPAYDQMNTVVAIKNFMTAFEDKSRSTKLMADDMARTRIVEKLKIWVNGNIQYFEP
jgi:hypothetical protein